MFPASGTIISGSSPFPASGTIAVPVANEPAAQNPIPRHPDIFAKPNTTRLSGVLLSAMARATNLGKILCTNAHPQVKTAVKSLCSHKSAPKDITVALEGMPTIVRMSMRALLSDTMYAPPCSSMKILSHERLEEQHRNKSRSRKHHQLAAAAVEDPVHQCPPTSHHTSPTQWLFGSTCNVQLHQSVDPLSSPMGPVSRSPWLQTWSNGDLGMVFL